MQIKIQKLHPEAITPLRMTSGAACFDLYACIDPDPGLIQPRRRFANAGAQLVVPTGLAVEIPQGHALMIYSRSGHGFKNGVRLSNCVGVIDADYRGEIAVSLQNDGRSALAVNHGDRIAQAMVIPVPMVDFVVVDELSSTERGAGGMGSTGVA